MSVPLEMTVVEIAAPGGPEQLKLKQRPVPQPGEGEVLVRVAAAGVNRPDVMQRQGRYPAPAGASMASRLARSPTAAKAAAATASKEPQPSR